MPIQNHYLDNWTYNTFGIYFPNMSSPKYHMQASKLYLNTHDFGHKSYCTYILQVDVVIESITCSQNQ